MDLELKRFQFFRAGTHKSSNGMIKTYTDSDLQKVADEYNQRTENRAPLYLYHPAQTAQHTGEPLGLVNKVELSNGKLYAHAYVTPKLRDLVRKGAFRAVSAGFKILKDRFNLDHIAFLNNPAVKNMEALNFSEHKDLIMFSSPLNTVDYSNDSESLHAAALAHQAQHGSEYIDAVRTLLREQDRVNFAESDTEDQDPNNHKLHREILDYQSQYGGTYENALAAVQRMKAFA